MNLTSSSAYQADLSNLNQVEEMAQSILKDRDKIDVLLNKCGRFQVVRRYSRRQQGAKHLINASWSIPLHPTS